MSPMDQVRLASYNHIVNDMFTMMICPIHSLISQCSSPWSLGAGSLYQDDRGECDADWVGRHLGTESLSILDIKSVICYRNYRFLVAGMDGS